SEAPVRGLYVSQAAFPAEHCLSRHAASVTASSLLRTGPFVNSLAAVTQRFDRPAWHRAACVAFSCHRLSGARSVFVLFACPFMGKGAKPNKAASLEVAAKIPT